MLFTPFIAIFMLYRTMPKSGNKCKINSDKN